MTQETLESLAIDTIARVNELLKLTHNYNDFGGVMGIRDEVEDITETLHRDLRRARRMAARLKSRVAKWEAGDRSVDLLNVGGLPRRDSDVGSNA